MHNMEKQYGRGFHCGLVSENRNVLFGLSMVMIILFHFSEDFHAAFEAGKVLPFPFWGGWILKYYRYVRSIGVELFVFMAGMGQYYSYHKNPGAWNYYKRRASRILIPYALLAIPFWFMVDGVLSKTGIVRYLEDLFFLTFFTDAEHALWFIGFILVMYLILPAVYSLFYGHGRFVGTIAFLVLTGLVIAANNGLRLQLPQTYLGIELAITRIPIFLIGVYAGKWIKEDRRLYGILVCIFVLGAIALKISMVQHGMTNAIVRYTDIAYALALLVVLTVLATGIQRLHWLHWLKNGLTLIGAYSLELYMTHVTVRSVFKQLKIGTWHVRSYVMVILLAILLSAGLKKMTDALTQTKA